MIKIEDGNVFVKGTRTDILADLSAIISGLKNELGIDKETINHVVDIAFMTDDELIKMLDNELDELIDMLTRKFDVKEEK